MLKLLKPERKENARDNSVEETENETRSFYTPTKSVRINSTQNNDPCSSRNNWMLNQSRMCREGVILGLFPFDSLESQSHDSNEISHIKPLYGAERLSNRNLYMV